MHHRGARKAERQITYFQIVSVAAVVAFVFVLVVPWKNSCLYAVVRCRYVCVPNTRRPCYHRVEPLFNGGRLLTRTIHIDCFVTYNYGRREYRIVLIVFVCFACRRRPESWRGVRVSRITRLQPIHGVWSRRKKQRDRRSWHIEPQHCVWFGSQAAHPRRYYYGRQQWR